MGKKTLFAAIAAMFFLTGPIVAAEKDNPWVKKTIDWYLYGKLIKEKIIEIEKNDPLGIITNEEKLKILKEKIKEKGKIGYDTITKKELKKLFAEILGEDEKKREGEEHWQKIKPTAKEWQKWQSSLDQIGRFQCIEGHKDLPFTYIFDTKEGHVWILESFSQISYIGRVFPLKEMDERIRKLP